jgi:hypothetical protein
MPLSAWLTFIAVSVVVYGGFILCLVIAIRSGLRQDAADDEEHQ